MSGINKVIIVGNLGMEPESKSTADGTQITVLNVALLEGVKIAGQPFVYVSQFPRPSKVSPREHPVPAVVNPLRAVALVVIERPAFAVGAPSFPERIPVEAPGPVVRDRSPEEGALGHLDLGRVARLVLAPVGRIQSEHPAR